MPRTIPGCPAAWPECFLAWDTVWYLSLLVGEPLNEDRLAREVRRTWLSTENWQHPLASQPHGRPVGRLMEPSFSTVELLVPNHLPQGPLLSLTALQRPTLRLCPPSVHPSHATARVLCPLWWPACLLLLPWAVDSRVFAHTLLLSTSSPSPKPRLL